MKILLTGASGFAGCHLAPALVDRGTQLVGTHLERPVAHAGMRLERLDLGDAAAVAALIEAVAPDAVVHTAAMSKTGACERDPESASRVNAAGTRHLVAALDAIRPRAHLIHFSTDLVYPGTHAFSREEDPPAPAMHYGRTKLAAEEAVAARRGPYTILRVALMYGAATPWAGGATAWMEEALRRGRRLELFADEHRTPVHVDDVVATVTRALDAPDGLGTLNCGGSERLSRVEMGEAVAEAMRAPARLIHATTRTQTSLDAPRAADVSMDVARLTALLGRSPLAFREAVRSVCAP